MRQIAGSLVRREVMTICLELQRSQRNRSLTFTKCHPGESYCFDQFAACHMEVATDEVREASRSRASDSPSPGEDGDVRTAWPDEEVRIMDVGEGGGLELGVFHVPTVAPGDCGLLLYNSYSSMTAQTLYKSFVFL